MVLSHDICFCIQPTCYVLHHIMCALLWYFGALDSDAILVDYADKGMTLMDLS